MVSNEGCRECGEIHRHSTLCPLNYGTPALGSLVQSSQRATTPLPASSEAADFSRAIADAEYGRETHQQWLDYLEHPDRKPDDGVNVEDVGTADQQRKWIERYDNILACLRAATLRRDEGVPHPEDSCKKCDRPNVVWFAPNELWNKYVRDNNEQGILCPVCFIQLVEQGGMHPTWSVAPRDWNAAPPPLTDPDLEEARRLYEEWRKDTNPVAFHAWADHVATHFPAWLQRLAQLQANVDALVEERQQWLNWADGLTGNQHYLASKMRTEIAKRLAQVESPAAALEELRRLFPSSESIHRWPTIEFSNGGVDIAIWNDAAGFPMRDYDPDPEFRPRTLSEAMTKARQFAAQEKRNGRSQSDG